MRVSWRLPLAILLGLLVRLPFWVRVYRNREVSEQESPFGGRWID